MIRITKMVLQELWGSRFRAAFAVMLMSGMLFAAVDSKACAVPALGKAPAASKIPFRAAAANDEDYDPEGRPEIVGLWRTVYTQDGVAPTAPPFVQTLKVWHGDGTEFEQAELPPVGGNICFGVWKRIGEHKFKLHHLGNMFDPISGKLAATFTNDETDTVEEGNKTYKGTWVFTVFGLDGTQLQQVTGTVVATRITVD